MKIGRKLTNVIASVNNARRPPATPPANRLARASGRNPEAFPRAATAAPAPSASAIKAAWPSDTTPTTIQRALINGKMPTTVM